MIHIMPATLHRADDDRLLKLACTFVGERLAAVQYAMPAGVIWGNGGNDDLIHEVDMGVELISAAGYRVSFSWATPGSAEGISISLDRGGRRASDDLISYIDADHIGPWSSLIGHSVQAMAVSFHAHSDDASTRPWSFRLAADDGVSVVVALGEITGDRLNYLPDSLVVIFDAENARSYTIASSDQSAWGEVILSEQ